MSQSESGTGNGSFPKESSASLRDECWNKLVMQMQISGVIFDLEAPRSIQQAEIGLITTMFDNVTLPSKWLP